MKRIKVINGPNLNFLGIREKSVYGQKSYEQLMQDIKNYFPSLEIEFFQSNHEGEIIDFLQKCHLEGADGIVLNAGAFTHYSYAIRDCIASINIPVIEVHMSNIHQREEFRHKSVISSVCIGQISGFGENSYILGIDALILNGN